MKNDILTSVELGALWTTYHKKTMILRVLEHLIQHAEDNKAKSLMSGLYEKLEKKVEEMEIMIKDGGAALPSGFTKEDINEHAPALFTNGFDVMFCRILKEISMGMYVLHTTISYRDEIINFYRELTELTHMYYRHFTDYLLAKEFLQLPTTIKMPNSVDFISDTSYMKGTNLLGQKRQLNTVEYGLLHHSVETNLFGMQLMKAFAQCSTDKEAKQYFTKGQQLSVEILQGTEKILVENNIPSPTLPGGLLTSSTEAPFSERLMLYCTYLLGGFSIGGQGFSSAFILRNDVIAKSAIFAKDAFEYTMEGAKVMMEKGWMEEPPKMEL
ncbi:DUF3231 family protein [Niallia taxi]|uniref:DUF3231 family protein n=1 Tax=Niallia taxi TaxID=2499688 RepID=UPI0039829F24